MTVPTTEPRTLRAGDSAAWRRELPAYAPADGWVLAYRLLFATATAVAVPATAAGDTAYTVALTSTATAAWPAGEATLTGIATRGTERATVYTAPITVLADLAAVANVDPLSATRRALADAEAALAAYMAGGGHIQQWTIGGKQLQFRSAADIIALIEFYRREVAREQVAATLAAGGLPGRVLVRNR